MARMAWCFSKRKKPRSYYELADGRRITVPWWKEIIIRAFGEQVMSTHTVKVYKLRGELYVLK